MGIEDDEAGEGDRTVRDGIASATATKATARTAMLRRLLFVFIMMLLLATCQQLTQWICNPFLSVLALSSEKKRSKTSIGLYKLARNEAVARQEKAESIAATSQADF